MDIIITFFFFLDYKFICFFLEGVREGERERNINVWLHAPYWGPGPQPRHVP